MTSAEFIEVTQEIERFYDKELSTEQNRIWFDELKSLTKERYRQISRQIYKTSKFMPKLADIIEIQQTLRTNIPTDNGKIYECNKCNGTGFVLYTKIVPNVSTKYPYQFAARCTCPNGLRMSSTIPTIAEVGIDNEI